MPLDIRPLDPEGCTVLFGAGVTCDAGGPTAWQLIAAIAAHIVSGAKWRTWLEENVQPQGALRFETVMDELAYTLDPTLNVLRFLNTMRPGRVHRALARGAGRGARLVTVNFDNLAERMLASEGIEPWTVNAQHLLGTERLHERGAVLKLHGSLLVNDGTGESHESSTPLHATITRIVSAGGGSGLPPFIEQRLREAVDGRVLIILGYSGSDDLDVMPSLSTCKPVEVLWVQHSHTSPELTPTSAVPPAVAQLMNRWSAQGAKVTHVSGATISVLEAAKWQVGSSDTTASSPARSGWEDYIQDWASEHSFNDPSGLGWVAQLLGSMGMFDLAHAALSASVPSKHGGLWSEQRRLLEIAENAYLRDVDFSEVRRLAQEARNVAARCDDMHTVASTHLLIARTFLNSYPQDLRAAEEALQLCRDAIPPAGAGGIAADLGLWNSRLLLAKGAYDESANAAANAAEMYRNIGELRLTSEALQVCGHALALEWRKEEALERLAEASRIAALGPYPERQIACDYVMAMIGDGMGDTDLAIKHARSAIENARRTNHTGELPQGYSFLGLALSENGAFAEAANAFERGLAFITAATASFRPLLACGLAECLLHIGRLIDAVKVLDENERAIDGDPRRSLQATAVRWRAGAATEEDVLALANQADLASAPVEGQTAFAILRLDIPGEPARRYLEFARALAAEAGQVERLSRMQRFRRDKAKRTR